MSTRIVKLSVINDINCAFCFIGHHELLEAVAICTDVLRLPISFEIEYFPYRLMTCIPDDLPLEGPKDTMTFLTKKLGKERFAEVRNIVGKWVKEKGVPISYDGVMSQSTRAHRLSRKAYLMGGQRLQMPMLDSLFKAYLQDEKDISDTVVLSELAEQAGLMTKAEAVRFLESDELKDEVIRLQDEARSKGVTGIPLTVIDGKWAVSGGQRAEVYVEIFKKLSNAYILTPPSASPSPFTDTIVSKSVCV